MLAHSHSFIPTFDIALPICLKIEKNIVFIFTSFVITFVFDMHLDKDVKILSYAFALLLGKFGMFITSLHVAMVIRQVIVTAQKLGAVTICYSAKTLILVLFILLEDWRLAVWVPTGFFCADEPGLLVELL